MHKRLLCFVVMLCCFTGVRSQFLMDMLDTTKEAGKGLLGIYKKYDHLRIGAYIQPQFQVIGSKGAKTFEGGDFAPNVSNRFMLRRSRLRIDYLHNSDLHEPGIQMVFQLDANERTFTVRDVWGRVFENRFQLFSFTMGRFARPFGYEVNLSSSDRESPERGRMSQTLMKSERDLGAMVTFDARKKGHRLKYLKVDLGVFNGQGINAAGDFDNRKDIIGRISLKPIDLTKKLILSAGISKLYGGLLKNTKYEYKTIKVAGTKKEQLDSTSSNLGQYSPRDYNGIDAQLQLRNKVGFSVIRAEYITGVQTGTGTLSETPSALVAGSEGFRIRHFNGAYFYFLQHLASLSHQLVIKYDWYDPNTKVKGKEIGAVNAGFSAANIKYNAWHFGYVYYLTDLTKLFLFYSIVKNESTALTGFTGDVLDNIFTCRMQFRF